MYFVEHRYSHDPTNWWIPNRACAEAMLRSAGFEIVDHPEEEVYICKRRERSRSREACVVEAVNVWNEPNNLSHWNFEIDPGWKIFAKMVNAAADAVRAERPASAARARRHLARSTRTSFAT